MVNCSVNLNIPGSFVEFNYGLLSRQTLDNNDIPIDRIEQSIRAPRNLRQVELTLSQLMSSLRDIGNKSITPIEDPDGYEPRYQPSRRSIFPSSTG